MRTTRRTSAEPEGHTCGCAAFEPQPVAFSNMATTITLQPPDKIEAWQEVISVHPGFQLVPEAEISALLASHK